MSSPTKGGRARDLYHPQPIQTALSAIDVGLEVFFELVAAQVTEIAGLKGRHDPERRALATEPSAQPCPIEGG